MSTPDYERDILRHIPARAPQPKPVDPSELDRDFEAASGDANVTAAVNGLRREVLWIRIERLDDPDAAGAAITEAVNAALAAAGSATDGGGDLRAALAQRRAELERSLDQISGRLDGLATDLDNVLKGL